MGHYFLDIYCKHPDPKPDEVLDLVNFLWQIYAPELSGYLAISTSDLGISSGLCSGRASVGSPPTIKAVSDPIPKILPDKKGDVKTE